MDTHFGKRQSDKLVAQVADDIAGFVHPSCKWRILKTSTHSQQKIMKGNRNKLV